jgi:pimeloyl-ACP methyl ester carboxylesterase
MFKILQYFIYGLLAILLIVGAVVGTQVHRDIPAAEIEKKYALPESKFIQIDGLRVHYTDEGNSKGPVVVLIHGTGASLHTWQGWLPVLKKYFRVVRVDLPAFGLTGPSASRDYSTAAYVKFLTVFLEKLNINLLMLVGNSLGGQVAWNFAATFPDRVNKLILIDSAGLPRLKSIPIPIRLARHPKFGRFARYVTPRFLVRNSLKEVYHDRTKITEKLVQRYFDMNLRDGNREAFIDRARQLKDTPGDALRKITAPTLIMWGRWDNWIPVAQAENFRKKILLSRVKIYDNAGHIPQEEIPEETALDALKFLK